MIGDVTANDRPRGLTGALLASLLVPLAGFVLGIRYLLRERVGPGLALILIGFVCFAVWGLLLSSVLIVGADHVLTEDAKRLKAIEIKIPTVKGATGPRQAPRHTSSVPIKKESAAELANQIRARERELLKASGAGGGP
jgi:hypothetical protein